MGYLRNAFISYYFGANGVADVLNIILIIPNTLRRLLADGSLDLAIIPELVKSHSIDNTLGQAKKLVQNVVALQLFIIVPLCFIGFLFPQFFVSLFVRFPDQERVNLAIKMIRFIMPIIFLLSFNTVFIAIYDSHRRFLLTAIIPVINSIIVILSLVLLHNYIGVFAVLWGILISLIIQTVVLATPLLILGYNFLSLL